jgi:hypothetical protein
MSMRKEKIGIKKTIAKKIEFRHKQVAFIKNSENTDEIKAKRQAFEISEKKRMDELDRLRIYGDGKKPIDVSLMSRDEMRTGIKISNEENSILNIGDVFRVPYSKKNYVDYDIVICIPSYERYEKIYRMLSQFYSQKTKYSFKIILLNDGSSDILYDKLVEIFPELIYFKNETPNGLSGHWYCYNQMWELLKNITCHAILNLDDDFILCDKFLDKTLNIFFREKERDNKILAIAPHTWSFNKIDSIYEFPKNAIDGISIFDSDFIKALNYQLNPVYFRRVSIGNSAGVWKQISSIINHNNYSVFRTEYSYVWHDGNDDSKLHGDFRKKKAIYTQNFIDGDLNYD